MVTPACVFCGHGNPAGAKYCNECAAPLHLKPCPECDAVNDRAAIICYKCGEPYSIDALVAETQRQSPASEALAAESQRASPASDAVVDQVAFGQSGPASLQRTTELPHEADRAAVRALTSPVAFFERSLGETVRRFPSPRRQATPVEVRPTLADRISPLRIGLLAVVVIGSALLSYLAYRFPAEADRGANSARAAAANADRIGTIRVTPLAGEIDVSAAKPVTAGAVVATTSASEVTLPAADSEQGVTSHSAALAAEPADAQSNAASTPSASIAKPPQKTKSRGALHPPVRRAVAAPSATMPARSPDADRFAVAPSAGISRDDGALKRSSPRACTEHVAALGLCTPQPGGGGT